MEHEGESFDAEGVPMTQMGASVTSGASRIGSSAASGALSVEHPATSVVRPFRTTQWLRYVLSMSVVSDMTEANINHYAEIAIKWNSCFFFPEHHRAWDLNVSDTA
jgi:hypothetical protein